MKRKVRITETQLNTIIKKALKEQQEEDQYMTGVDQDKMSGGPEDEEGGQEGGEPNFEAFMSAAQELMGQGITIGGLVDKLCAAKDTEAEPEAEPEVEPQGEPQTEPDANIAESKKKVRK